MKRFSSFNQSPFDHTRYNYRNDNNLSNTMTKQILNYNHAENDISTLNSHVSSLLQFFTPSKHHPILDMSAVQHSKFISWMIAATYIPLPRQTNQDRSHDLPHTCRLCHSSASHESRQHLLTDCPLQST
jgi:hypothetical protein